MRQLQPKFGETFDPEKVAEMLNPEKREIDLAFPVQEVSTGLQVMIVPLKTLAAVKKAKINRDRYFEFISHTEAKTVLVFAPETYKPANDINVRFFADCYGIPEDPATGSANGCLAAYLVKYRYFGAAQISLRVEQGYEIGRPSLLFLNAEEKNRELSVFVGGKVVSVAKGKLV